MDTTSVIILVFLRSWAMLAELWYYIVAGIVAGSLATVLIPADRLSKLFAGRSGKLLVFAAAAGIASPLCTYSTVPFFLGMLKRGMPIGPIAAFLVASAALNPQMIALTVGALGWHMAVAQMVTVLAMSIIVGGLAPSVHRQKLADIEGGAPKSHHMSHGHSTERSSVGKQLLRTALGIAEHVVFYFVIGLLVANLVAVIVNVTGLLNHISGLGRWYTIPLASLIGIPLYVCGGAAIPMLQVGGAMGVSQGAILAFLIVGPATRIVQLVGLSTIFSRWAITMYIVFVIIFAMACGFTYDVLPWGPLHVAPSQGIM